MRIAAGAALWLGTDPVQPFAGSRYAQTQIFEVEPGGSVGLVDWVTEGRSARGERWAMDGWRGKNEIWEVRRSVRNGKTATPTPTSGTESTTKKAGSTGEQGQEQEQQEEEVQEHKILKIRDSLILQCDPITGLFPSLSSSPPSPSPTSTSTPTPTGVFGTLILHGPLFTPLSTFFLSEFSLLSRIGARNWDDDDNATAAHPLVSTTTTTNTTTTTTTTPSGPRASVLTTQQQQRQRWRAQRQQQEKKDGVLWTAARVRGGNTTVVKFSANHVEGGRRWLRWMLRAEEEEEGEEGEGAGEEDGEGEGERGLARMFGQGGMMFLR